MRNFKMTKIASCSKGIQHEKTEKIVFKVGNISVTENWKAGKKENNNQNMKNIFEKTNANHLLAEEKQRIY